MTENMSITVKYPGYHSMKIAPNCNPPHYGLWVNLHFFNDVY